MHDDLLSLLPKADFTRREFVVTTLAAGFALAVQPVSAQTITTDTKGLEAGEVKIPVADGEIPAYRAMPAKGGPFPVVLVVQEIFGVHEHIKDICRRLAKLGYLAVAPELYARQGDVSKIDGHPGDHLQGRLQGARRPGDVRPRRDRRLGQEDRQGRHGEARHHRLLLGRPDRLAVRGPQPEPEGGRGLVRPAGRRARRAAPEAPDRPGRRRSRPRCSASTAGPTGHPGRVGREDARGPQGGGQDRPRSSSTPTPPTPSTPTTGRATARTRPRTAGSGCWRGSRSTASPESKIGTIVRRGHSACPTNDRAGPRAVAHRPVAGCPGAAVAERPRR